MSPAFPTASAHQRPFWPNDARIAVSLVINVEEGAEYNPADGDTHADNIDETGSMVRGGLRNVTNETNYEYGRRVGGPRILRLFARYGVKASMTAAAVALERSPELTRMIVEGGHEVVGHGYRWAYQYRMDEAAERAFIRKAADSIERTAGRRPQGWLCRYLSTPNTRRILAEEGFTYHMDDASDDMPFWDQVNGKPFLVIPYAFDTNDIKLWPPANLGVEEWGRYARDTFDWLYAEGAEAPRMMTVGLHQRIIGRPGRIVHLDALLRHMVRRPGVWFATRAEIAAWWARQHPPA